LPAPFGPRKPSTSPGFTANERWSTAILLPNCLVRFSTSIMDGKGVLCPVHRVATSTGGRVWFFWLGRDFKADFFLGKT